MNFFQHDASDIMVLFTFLLFLGRDGKFRESVQHPGTQEHQLCLTWETEAIFTEVPLSKR